MSSTIPTIRNGLTLRVGRLVIIIRPAFFLIPLLGAASLGVSRALLWSGVVLASVLIHELGHASAMRWFGFNAWIELHALGGYTHWLLGEGQAPRAGQRFVVTLAGPSAGLLLGVALLLVQVLAPPDPTSSWAFVVQQGLFINFAWSIINLAPIIPWDGGALLDSGLEVVTGRRRPIAVGVVAIVTAALMVPLAVWWKSVLLGYFALRGAMSGWELIRRTREVSAIEVVQGLLNDGHPAEAERAARAGLERAQDPTVRAALVELLAWARLFQKDDVGARRLLEQHGLTGVPELRARLAAAQNDERQVVAILEPQALEGAISQPALPLLVSALIAVERPEQVLVVFRALAQKLGFEVVERALAAANGRLFEAGAFQASFELTAFAAERSPHPLHAYNAACALARLGRLDEALGWVGRALQGGFADRQKLEQDHDLDPLRALPGWAPLLASLPAAPAP